MRKIMIFIVTQLVVICLYAKIEISPSLGDNMVLQRNAEVKLWGNAKPNQILYITTSWNNVVTKCCCDEKGEWLVKVKTTKAGGPYTISLTAKEEKVVLKNILLGEVWLCSGQSNMEMPIMGFTDQPVNNANEILADTDNGDIRLFTVVKNSTPFPQKSCNGKWEMAYADNVAKFSAIGYLFAKQLQKKLKVPVGIICSSWGGANIEAWMSQESINKFPITFARAQNLTLDQQKPMHLYNGMIYPILNQTIKGVIWYQGEANIGNYSEYASLMKELVENWRKEFKLENFPFYFVQIAPYSYDDSKGINSALQRDEQQKASLLIPRTGIVTTIDIGDENCIHPADKSTVAKRLSYWAFSDTYGSKGIAYKCPYYKESLIKDNVMVISFENVEHGLTTFGGKLDNFEIAGEDRLFRPAEAKILNSQIEVWSTDVRKPVAVRYAFHNFPQGKGFIYNVNGLPVPSFRTDNW